jgi:hypothetical protein
VNKLKYHSVATDNELKREITIENLDETMHRILQHKIR